MVQPTNAHWHAMKILLRYLYDTSSHCLTSFKPKSLFVMTYCDEDWALYCDDSIEFEYRQTKNELFLLS